MNTAPVDDHRPGSHHPGIDRVDRHRFRIAACGSTGMVLVALVLHATGAAAQQPASPHGRLVVPCSSCHTAVGWKPAQIQASFDHGATGFALDGAHRATSCTACHASLEFSRVETSCAGCHQDIHRSEFGVDCTQCHDTRAFNDRSTLARRHALTRFPLVGAHGEIDCRSCHAPSGGALAFRGVPVGCAGCHLGDFNRTRAPPHKASAFPTDCTACHTAVTWTGGAFDHQATRFQLTGAHLARTCQDCHADGVYRARPTACIACHQTAYDGTATLPHRAAGFGTDCTTCHTTATWAGGAFDHQATQFPLSGAHLARTCQDCHADGVYRAKPTACIACHQAAYDGTATLPHRAAGFSTDCTACHTTATWAGAPFDHEATQFPLTGAHLATTCQQCHADGVYRGKPTTCVSCHQSDYTRTANPAHQPAGFPTTCATCHTTVTWTGGAFDHQATRFPLTGAHLATSCQQCHADGVYRGKPTTCVSCHQSDYTRTANPPHQAAGFPTTCATCHTTVTWTGGAFDHQATQFPLTGAHLATTCQQCHADGVYRGKPTTCVSCHQSDYAGTVNPAHQAAGFPTTCATCHTTSTWTGATFDHDARYFPIYSGKHKDKWSRNCASCHPSSASYLIFTCLTCHEHSQAKMDDKHKGKAGYSYSSQACYSCHPTGKK